MYGAILGDMIGAPYEFDRGNKTKDFPLFGAGTEFTDDTVMTIAIADALIVSKGRDDDNIRDVIIICMQEWGRKYPDAGYGGMFRKWLTEKEPKPYGSFGNGSAMRVSSVGWLYDTLEETRKYARMSAEVTHNHPEGIKGAEATASAIYLARTGSTKEEIKDYIINEFHYDLSRTCDEIRPHYHHVESCQETVPEAITAFLEGESFEDVIRTAVSLGGDCDTLTCIAGGIAEAYYGIPDEIMKGCIDRVSPDIEQVMIDFDKVRKMPDIKRFISIFKNNNSEQSFLELLSVLSDSYVWIPCNAIMSGSDYKNIEQTVMDAVNSGDVDSLIGHEFSNQDHVRLVPDILQSGDEYFFPVFTSEKEMGEYGEQFSKVEKHFLEAIMLAKNNETELRGIVVNAFSDPFVVDNRLFELIEEASKE